jgi:2'-5' RNA ligase
VTLRFFGEIDVDDGVVAGQGVAEAAKLATPAVAELGPAVARLGRNVLQVPVSGLEALAQALVDRSAGIGQPPPPRPFSGHVTLARNRGKAPLDDIVGEAVSGRWTVDEIALVASVSSGRSGVANSYDVVATFPLEG